MRLFAFSMILLCCYGVRAQQLTTYPAPQAAIYPMHNDDYTVRVRKPGGEWQDLYEYNVKVDQVKGTSHHVESASMCSFDFLGEAEVAVKSNKGKIQKTCIRPLSYGIKPEVKGDIIYFRLFKPQNLSVEINGDIFHNLHLFANPIDAYVPDKKDTNLVYFGPGVHKIPGGKINITSGKTIYLAGGAVLMGQLLIEGVHDVKILGRGIVDPSAKMGIRIAHSKNIVVEGIVTTQCSTGESDSVTIRNEKKSAITVGGMA